MSQQINLLECSFERLRLLVPMWSNSIIKEALRKFRATFQAYAKRMNEQEELELLRKEQIVYNELRLRMKKAGYKNHETHWTYDKLIGHNTHEQAIKIGRK